MRKYEPLRIELLTQDKVAAARIVVIHWPPPPRRGRLRLL